VRSRSRQGRRRIPAPTLQRFGLVLRDALDLPDDQILTGRARNQVAGLWYFGAAFDGGQPFRPVIVEVQISVGMAPPCRHSASRTRTGPCQDRTAYFEDLKKESFSQPSFELNDQVERVGDVALDGRIGQLDTTLQNAAGKSRQSLLG